MILVELRDAIINQIKESLPSLKEVKPHGGRFSLAELKNAAAKSPSVRVACLGINDVSDAAIGVEAVTTWAAYVVAGDIPQQHRDAVALSIVGSLLPLVPNSAWDLDDQVDGARQVRADNLFSREIDRNGVALWAVTWRHTATLNQVDMATLDDFLHLRTEFDIDDDGKSELTDDLLFGPPDGFQYLMVDGEKVRNEDGSFVYVPEES